MRYTRPALVKLLKGMATQTLGIGQLDSGEWWVVTPHFAHVMDHPAAGAVEDLLTYFNLEVKLDRWLLFADEGRVSPNEAAATGPAGAGHSVGTALGTILFPITDHRVVVLRPAELDLNGNMFPVLTRDSTGRHMRVFKRGADHVLLNAGLHEWLRPEGSDVEMRQATARGFVSYWDENRLIAVLMPVRH